MISRYRPLLFAVVICAAFFSLYRFNRVHQSVPDITFTDIDGQTHSFHEYQGKPLLVIFWATDCPGCIQEIPELVKLYHDYHNQGLAMIAIAMSHDSLPHIQSLRDKRQLPYTITWDKNGRLAAAFDRVRVTPTQFLVNPQGKIVMRKIGSLDIKYLMHKLENMGINAR